MASNQNILVDLLGSVIDDMRYTDTIISSNETSAGVYTINSLNSLVNNEVVSINGSDYIVSQVSDDGFVINAETGLDFTGLTWKSLAPYYEHGHILEIANTLSEKDKANGVFSYQKYPLIILKQDYKWTRSVDKDAIFAEVLANIIICNSSDPNYKAKDRYDVNIRPVEYPLYDRFMESIFYSGLFNVSTIQNPVDHDGYDRPFWGSDINPNNTTNILNDYIDAIELQNVRLEILRGNEIC